MSRLVNNPCVFLIYQHQHHGPNSFWNKVLTFEWPDLENGRCMNFCLSIPHPRWQFQTLHLFCVVVFLLESLVYLCTQNALNQWMLCLLGLVFDHIPLSLVFVYKVLVFAQNPWHGRIQFTSESSWILFRYQVFDKTSILQSLSSANQRLSWNAQDKCLRNRGILNRSFNSETHQKASVHTT